MEDGDEYCWPCVDDEGNSITPPSAEGETWGPSFVGNTAAVLPVFETGDDFLTLTTGCGYACQLGGEEPVGWGWRAVSGAALFVPAVGGAAIRQLRYADDVAEIANLLPRTKRYSRAVPEWVAELILQGKRDILLAPPGESDVFITAAEDLARYRTQRSVEKRLTLTQGKRAIVTFIYEGPIASPVFRNNPGFIQGGRTLGGAREWVIPNKILSALNITNIRVRWLK